MTPVTQNTDRELRNDPLLYDVPLPLQRVFYPMGFALEIASNSEEVLCAAEECWGRFPRLFDEPPLQTRIMVLADASTECPPTPVFRGCGNLVTMVADAANFGICDLDRGVCFCWLNAAVVGNRDYLRYHFLDGLAMMLIESRYGTPVHAGCVIQGGRGVLFCGEPGAGKSSLALACAQRGWTFVSDDVCCLLRGSDAPTLVGNPYRMRFRESATRMFPELGEQLLVPHGGELTIELMTATVPDITTAPVATPDHLIFLNRQPSGPATLTPYPREAALQYLQHVVCYGSERLRREQIESLKSLLEVELLELRYSDLNDAVGRLEWMVSQAVPRSVA